LPARQLGKRHPALAEAAVTIEIPAHMHPSRSFQGLILTLHNYWADYGCLIL
jgi:glycyl-tRNA synthetase alpha chain